MDKVERHKKTDEVTSKNFERKKKQLYPTNRLLHIGTFMWTTFPFVPAHSLPACVFFVPPFPPLHLFHIVYYFFGPSSTRTHLFACLVVKRRGNSLNIIPRTDKQINANNLVAWCADTAHQAQLDLNSPQTSFFPTFLMLIDFEKSYRQY